jgi:4-carboxymuconolactone decarboxylase
MARPAVKKNDDRRARALKIYKKIGWGENEGVKDVDMDLWGIITDVMFGDIWSRPGLSLRDRELVTLGVLVSERAEGLKLHMRNAHHLGITMKEMKEVIFQVMYYSGQACGLYAMRRLKEVMNEPEVKARSARRPARRSK